MKNRLLQCMLFTLMLSPLLAQADNLQIQVNNPDGSQVQDVVIFAEPLDSPIPVHTTQRIEIKQKDRAFAPYITVMQRQDDVVFSNQDDFTHHIYSISGENRFSFKLKAGEERPLETAASGQSNEAIAMGCNIHDWMSGYLLILDTPYFAKTDSQGQLSLQLEKPGRYRLTLWHPQLQADNHQLQQELEINTAQNLTWSLPKPLVVELPEADEEAFDFLDKY